MDLPTFQEAGSEVLTDGVASWLMSQALSEASLTDIFEGCCTRMLGAGIPLVRGLIAFRMLHPLFGSVSLVWRRGHGVDATEHLHSVAFSSEQWLQSPMHYLLSTGTDSLRRRLTGDDVLLDFPVLAELQALGVTDYLGLATSFGKPWGPEASPDGVVTSWATERASGFNDWDISQLQRLTRRLAVACKVQIKDQIAQNVVDTYLGPDAGRRVLSGQIRRGDGTHIHAVVWYSDMRDSTPLAEALGPDRFLALINSYFECTAGAVLAAGGQVLRFIGDAVLAIFPVDAYRAATQAGSPPERGACQAALGAARDAEQRIDALNAQRGAQGLTAIDFGLGLHLGEVIYGNIGVPERLEFSVIGSTANQVARIETLSKVVGRRVLASAEFAAHAPGQWDALGVHTVRGVGAPVEVFALR
ncbi:MAG: adenylate/guanylate cyclase domain-containing protein [Rubrivivax sp.]|nr:adenylate/guanylate cyclase domain-containing protein [Rubrivivax sp.]